MKIHRLHADKIKRIVVSGANWVGDAAMTVPALKRLRHLLPHSHITLATRPWATGIFAECDFIDDLLVQETAGLRPLGLLKQVKEWRRRDFDLAILFPNAFAPALVATLAGVTARMGYPTDGRRFLLSHPISVPQWRAKRHEVFYYLNIIDTLEEAVSGKPQATGYEPDSRINLSEARRATARAFLIERGFVEAQTLVAICPGSINSRAKRWPAERFAALADLLMEDGSVSVVLIGSKDEVDVSLEVQAQMTRRPIMLAGQTDLSQAVGILGIADLLITNDTGPAHIASALDCPTLVIFGPTNPDTTRPFSNSSEIIRKPPDCAPCMLRDCPIDHRCMTAITPAEVFARAVMLMRRLRTGAVAI